MQRTQLRNSSSAAHIHEARRGAASGLGDIFAYQKNISCLI